MVRKKVQKGKTLPIQNVNLKIPSTLFQKRSRLVASELNLLKFKSKVGF